MSNPEASNPEAGTPESEAQEANASEPTATATTASEVIAEEFDATAPRQQVEEQAPASDAAQDPAPAAAAAPPAPVLPVQQAVPLPPTPPHAPVPPAPQASVPPQAPLPPQAPVQVQVAPQTVPQVAAPQAPAKPQGRLSGFLKISIILLAALSIAAIALVFIGDFEGKVERITATFLIFAVFVGLTAADTNWGRRSSWYAPVALIANSYILALLLIVTWMSKGDYFLGWTIFWKSVVVIGVTRLVVGCCQLLLGMGEGKPEALGRFSFVTSVLAVLSGILFTAPLAIEVFNVVVPDLYWKIAVSALLLTALGLAITLLLRWSYGSQDREAARQARQAQALAARQAGAYPGAVPPPLVAQPQVQPQPGRQLLPWPTFADGRPLPVGPDGQPDFTVPGAPQPPSAG
jgi:hypothetical protein